MCPSFCLSNIVLFPLYQGAKVQFAIHKILAVTFQVLKYWSTLVLTSSATPMIMCPRKPLLCKDPTNNFHTSTLYPVATPSTVVELLEMAATWLSLALFLLNVFDQVNGATVLTSSLKVASCEDILWSTSLACSRSCWWLRTMGNWNC